MRERGGEGEDCAEVDEDFEEGEEVGYDLVDLGRDGVRRERKLGGWRGLL